MSVVSKSKIKASDMNRRITIRKLLITPDGQGGSVETWSDVLTRIPANVTHLMPSKMGSEKYIAHQLYGSDMINVKIRYRTSVNIDDSMQLLYRSKIYNIRSVQVPDEALQSIIIMAEEIQAKGSAE